MSVQLWNTKLLKLIQIFHEYCIKKKENSYKNKSTQRAQFPKEGQSYNFHVLWHFYYHALMSACLQYKMLMLDLWTMTFMHDVLKWRMLLSFLPLWLEQNWMTSLVLQAVKTWDSKIYSCSLHNVLLSFDSWLLFGKG